MDDDEFAAMRGWLGTTAIIIVVVVLLLLATGNL